MIFITKSGMKINEKTASGPHPKVLLYFFNVDYNPSGHRETLLVSFITLLLVS